LWSYCAGLRTPKESKHSFLQRLDAAVTDRLKQRLIIALVLVGVGERKLGDGFIKARVRPKVTADRRSIARLRECARERPTAPPRVEPQPAGTDAFDQRLDLDIPKLTNVKMSSFIFGPSKEEVARRLHQPLSNHDALSAIRVAALPGVSFEHAHTRFLH